MKKLLSIILTVALVLGTVILPANATESEPLNEAPAIPTEGDVWDGSILQPSKLVTKDGVTYYEITKCAELAYVAQTGGEWLGYNYILGNNLILNDVVFTWDEEGNLTNTPEEIEALNEWVPIDSFSGIFDGNGCYLTGLYIFNDTEFRVGLFRFLSIGGTLRNLNLANGYIRGSNEVGGFVGYAHNSLIDNCSFSGCVIADNSNKTNVLAGGITGDSCGQINNSVASGQVNSSGYAGGIAGNTNGTRIGNCISYVNITASTAGGLVGGATNNPVTIVNSCSHGNVVGISYAGGFIGYGFNCSISSCFASGNTISTNGSAGGFIGKYCNYYGTIENCFSLGNVHASSFCGGFAGICGETIKNCYALGSVLSGEYQGALVGENRQIWGEEFEIANCFYTKDTGVNEDLYAFGNRSEDGSVAGDAVDVAEAKTLSELKQQTTFVNWDFTNTWHIDPTVNGGYPYLAWQTFDDSPIAVNGISLDKNTLSLAAGDYAYLSAGISPATATDKTVKWTSDTPAVATVSAAGKVEAISAGTAVITVTSADGQYSASCTVTVNSRIANEYELKKLSLRDSSGNQLSAIPKTDFWATVAIKNLASEGNSMVLLATYDTNGRYLGMNAAWVEDVPVGSTVSVSFLLSNSDGKIAEIKSFCVASFSNLTPLGDCLSFPQ